MPKPLYGQVAVTGTAQKLDSSGANPAAFTIKAPKSNKNPIFLGDSSVTTSNGHQLDAGDDFTYELLSQNGQPAYQLRPSDIYVVGTSGDKATWFGSPS